MALTQVEYYKLVAIMQQMDTLFNQMHTLVQNIDPTQLPVVGSNPYAAPAPPPTPLGGVLMPPAPAPNPGALAPVPNPPNPPAGKKLNQPVIMGPMADVVKAMQEQKAAQAAKDAGKHLRKAPYEAAILDVSIDPHDSRKYWARVLDKANKEEGLVQVGKEVHDDYVANPKGMLIDLEEEDLRKIEWESASPDTLGETPVGGTTLQDVIDSGDPELTAMAQATAANLGMNPGQIVFADPEDEEE